jgi:acetyl esterase/lipase
MILLFAGNGWPQATKKLGSRRVPGPLPPRSDAAMPQLDQMTDIVYGEAGGQKLKLDFAKPTICRNQNVPLVIYVHGGGWRSGDKSGAFQRGDSRMFFQLGFAVASINYRLAPQSHFPAQIYDCKLAVRYLRNNAEELGIDPDKIGIWGSSAGGHLVCLMGTANESDGLEGPGLEGISSRVSAVVDHFGPTDLTVDPSQTTDEGRSMVLDFLGCMPSDCMALASLASPVSYVTPDDPPVLILHGEKDSLVPFNQAVRFAEKLKLVGNACALIKVKNAEHGFVPMPLLSEITPSLEGIYFLTVAHLARYLEPALFGDLNMDGRQGFLDVKAMMRCFGAVGVGPNTAPAPTNWNPLADLFPDGIIDTKDWILLFQPE